MTQVADPSASANDLMAQVLAGVPAAAGRWQPTRSGVVNSWAWADETFPFADGWLALTGPNGSGKSLTCSMWITPLLDADVSQKALSIDGSASGTLTSRHTNREPAKNATGIWWLEYGRRTEDGAGRSGAAAPTAMDGGGTSDGVEGANEVEYVTTGMWLRSSGGDLQRAFFYVPGRVGHDLHLSDAERNPVTADELAAQLAPRGGRFFASSKSPARSRALAHLPAVEEEADFAETVRRELFHPLDPVQFAALNATLRSLRSIRTGKNVSPEEMRKVLTEALPSLDADRLGPIAEAMEKISDLEAQLDRAQGEISMLAAAEKAYTRYTEALVAEEAAELLAAVTQFDDARRRKREADDKLATARAALAQADLDRTALDTRVARLDGEAKATSDALRDHAGAELPQLEEAARKARAHAEHAARLAATATQESHRAQSAAQERRQEAQRELTALRRSAELLRDTARHCGATAAVEQLLASSAIAVAAPVEADAAGHDTPTDPAAELDGSVDVDETGVTGFLLGESGEGGPQAGATRTDAAQVGALGINAQQLSAAPLTWVERRRAQLRAITEALTAHQSAVTREADAAGDVRAAERQEDSATRAATEATSARVEAQAAVVDDVTAWQQSLVELPTVPGALLFPDHDERCSAQQLREWLSTATQHTRDRIDLTGHRNALAHAENDLSHHTRALQEATAAVERVQRALEQAERGLQDAQARATREAIEDERRAGDAKADNAAAHQEADRIRGRAAQAVAAAEREHDRQVVGHLAAVARWRVALVQLDPQLVPLPAVLAGGAGLDAVNEAELGPDSFSADIIDRAVFDPAEFDPASIRLAASVAFERRSTGLARAEHAAEGEVARVQGALDELRGKVEQAQTAAPVPPLPPWSTRGGDALPLWSVVDFADHLSEDERDTLEGALLVSGLLDAVLAPEGTLRHGENTLTGLADAPTAVPLGGPATPARTLNDVLVVEPGIPVSDAVVRALLASVPLAANQDHPSAQSTASVAGASGNGSVASPFSVISTGVLTARSPECHHAQYIGRTTRERARKARLDQLRTEETALMGELDHAEAALADVRAAQAIARAEKASLPDAEPISTARAVLAATHTTENNERQRALAVEHAADISLQEVLAGLALRANLRDEELAELQRRLHDAQGALTEVNEDRAVKQASVDVAQDLADGERHNVAEAQVAQDTADAEAATFPSTDDLTRRCDAEDSAQDTLAAAKGDRLKADDRHQQASTVVKRALAELHRTARTDEGTVLPTDRQPITQLEGALEDLSEATREWRSVADRAASSVGWARSELTTAARTAARAGEATHDAHLSGDEAESLEAELETRRALYGADYDRLSQRAAEAAEALRVARDEYPGIEAAKTDAVSAQRVALSVLGQVEPERQAAETLRDDRFRLMCRVVDEELAGVPDPVPVDHAGRPANLTAGVSWARTLLEKEPVHDRVRRLRGRRGTRMSALENAVRSATTQLASHGRQITLVSVEGTEWRRAEVAAPDAGRGEDLRSEVQALRDMVEQLQSDLRDDVKQVLKTSMFTQLRSDIRLRRETARELVRQISATLAGVRTGVARVGVRVSWDVRDDEDSRQMIDLITAPPSDESFDRMYEVLRSRMDESAGEEWAKRVERTFDYRDWHEWKIEVTHRAFSDPDSARSGRRGRHAGVSGTPSTPAATSPHAAAAPTSNDGTLREAFLPVTARSNPLAELSTGERRLATMLPLLAAAWSMYSGDGYCGPRIVSIDELDATFDDSNLRQVLALLRSWDLDVISTAPSLTPLIKAEAGCVVIAQVDTAGDHRVSVPWLWAGDGEAEPITDNLFEVHR